MLLGYVDEGYASNLPNYPELVVLMNQTHQIFHNPTNFSNEGGRENTVPRPLVAKRSSARNVVPISMFEVAVPASHGGYTEAWKT